MFGTLTKAPDDPILGLKAAFDRDPRTGKINLSAGVFKDANGQTPIFRSVKLAEARLLEGESSKDYLPIEGARRYDAAVQELVLGKDHEAARTGRAVTAQTPGGTAALRVAAEVIARVRPGGRIWVSQPTWPNHPSVFQAAGLAVATYPYFDAATNSLRFPAMLAALEPATPGDVVLLHGCCHNPTGIDPTQEQWAAIGEFLAARDLIPLIDFAYQGLAEGLREDARGLLQVVRPGRAGFVASSFSKNFGLYNDRIGALTLLTESAGEAEVVLSHTRQVIRANYSNPPAHGALIVEVVLGDPELRTLWEGEVTDMRARINGMRQLFVERLRSAGVTQDFAFVTRQRGMFSFTGLTKEQVLALRERFGIYIVDSGRINVAGITEKNVDALCAGIATVLGDGR